MVCDLGATPPQVAASPSPIGGIALHEPPTRRRHAARRLRVVQTPTTAGVEGTGGAGGRRQDQRVAVPGCGTRGRRQGLAGQRADAPSEARGADESRAGRRPRAHKAARPGTTARGPLHPLRAAAPDQKGCTAYGSGAAHPITRTNAESARRPPTISQASSMIGPKAATATRLTTSGRVRIRHSPGSMHQAEATPGHPLPMVDWSNGR